MKGVMLGICPDVQFVDITHDIPPQSIVPVRSCNEIDAAPHAPVQITISASARGTFADKRAGQSLEVIAAP